MPPDARHDRRRNDDEPVLHRELREAMQPLYDLKARTEPWLRFLDEMRVLNVERGLPALLHDENVRQIMSENRGTNWRRLRNWAIVLGAIASIGTVTAAVVSIITLLLVLNSPHAAP